MATPSSSDDAIRWRVFRMTVDQVREKFADIPADELDALIEEAAGAARTGQRAGRTGAAHTPRHVCFQMDNSLSWFPLTQAETR